MYEIAAISIVEFGIVAKSVVGSVVHVSPPSSERNRRNVLVLPDGPDMKR